MTPPTQSVLYASVAVRWLAGEPGSERARIALATADVALSQIAQKRGVGVLFVPAS